MRAAEGRNTYREALLPVEGGAHGGHLHGQQAQGPPGQAQLPSAGLHTACAQRVQAAQLRQRPVGQSPLQREPFLREHKPPVVTFGRAWEMLRPPHLSPGSRVVSLGSWPDAPGRAAIQAL